MKWKDEYELGIDDIDNQHKKLIEIINNYNHSISDSNTNSIEEIGQIIIYLINYTCFHFKAEEIWMAKLDYPDIDTHMAIHQDLIDKLRDILLKIKRKESYTPIEFYYFLMSWLNDHILGEDLKIGKFSKKTKHILKSPKIPMINPEALTKKIILRLSNIEDLLNKKIITNKDSDFRRIIYLEDLFDKYLLDNLESFTNIIKLLFILVDSKIIIKIEKDQLCNVLLLEKNLKRLKIEFNDKEDFIEIDSLINKLIK